MGYITFSELLRMIDTVISFASLVAYIYYNHHNKK